MSHNFTLSNPLIKDYLEGTGEYIPTSEVLYINSHFVKDSFLSEIEVMIQTLVEDTILNPELSIPEDCIEKLMEAAIKLGDMLPLRNSEKAAKDACELIREIYQLVTKHYKK